MGFHGANPKRIFVTASKIMVAFFVTIFPATVWPLEIGEQDLGITVGSTYVTKYIWRGYDLLDDHGAWQPSITLDYRGFYIGVWGSWAVDGGFVDATELDYFIGYERTLFTLF